MTVTSGVSSVGFQGDATTTVFPFIGQFFAPTDLVVTLLNQTTGLAVTPAPVLNGTGTYDYTVTGTQDSGTGEYLPGASVTFNTAPAANFAVHILRNVAATQNVALLNNTLFPAKTIEGALDRLTMLAQQFLTATALALTLPVGDPAGLTTVLPSAVLRAGQILAFDGSGNVTVTGNGAQTGNVSITTALANGGTQSRSLAQHFGDVISVKDFGAIGDGVTDDTAAIQAAFTYGGTIYFPNPTGVTQYLVSSAITVSGNTLVLGNGCQVQTNSVTADIFQLGTTSESTVSRITISDLSVWSTVVKTAGAAFKAKTSLQNTNFRNVQAGSLDNYTANGQRLWNGWDMTASFDRVWLDGACFGIAANAAVLCSGTSTRPAAGLQMDAHLMFSAYGIYVAGGVGGVYINGEVSVNTVGIQVDTSVSGTSNREVFIQPGADVDTCSNYGLYVAANSLTILEITGAWFASTGQSGGLGVGIFIGPHTNFTLWAKITGARIYNNAVTGIVNDGSAMLLSASFLHSNAAALILQGTGSSGSSVQSCSFNNNTGTCIALSTISEYSICDNNFYGNTGNNITGAQWSAQQTIRGNTGYQTANSGTVIMNSGSATVTFNHGLVGTPAFVVAFTNDGTSIKYYEGVLTSTTITINATANAASNITINWTANMGTNS